MSKQILVNSNHYETRVAILENGEIKALHIEREEDRNVVGNVYKGVVKRVLPGMQAAFLELGLERTAFLYVDDIVQDPFGNDVEVEEDETDEAGPNDSLEEGEWETSDDDAGADDGEEVKETTEAELTAAAPSPGEEKPQALASTENSVEADSASQEVMVPADDLDLDVSDRIDDALDEDDDDDEEDEEPYDDEEEVEDEDLDEEGDADLESAGELDGEVAAPAEKTVEAVTAPASSETESESEPAPSPSTDNPPNEDQAVGAQNRPPFRGHRREARTGRAQYRSDAPQNDDDSFGNRQEPREGRGPRRGRGDSRNRSSNRDRGPRNRDTNRDNYRTDSRDYDNRSSGGSYRDDRPRDNRYRDDRPRNDRQRNYNDDAGRERNDSSYRSDRYSEENYRDNQRSDHRDDSYDRPSQNAPRRDRDRDRDRDRSNDRNDRSDRGDRGGRRNFGRGDRSRRSHAAGGGEYEARGSRREPRRSRDNRRRRPPRKPRERQNIQDLLKEGQEILVQVAKAPIGTKGARLTTHISLPGRNLVLMPTVKHIGISRRIGHDRERRRLREMFTKKIRPRGVGFIIRTVAENKSFRELKADTDYLVKLWMGIKKDSGKKKAPALIHEDLSLAMRAVRDFFTDDVDQFIIDDPAEYENVLAFIGQFMPRLKGRVKLFKGPTQLFEHYGIEAEISRALGKKVWLKSGGYLLVDQSEALTAIDVNTGRYVGSKSLEETILKTNLEAVKEIAYQLRIRNIGGIIIIDLIDMENAENREKVFAALQDALGEDRARTNILKISDLGLVEMTRKRTHEDLVRYLTESCGNCEGRGYHKSTRTVCFEIFREIEKESLGKTNKIVVFAHPDVVTKMTADEKEHVSKLQTRLSKEIMIHSDPQFHVEQFEVFGKN